MCFGKDIVLGVATSGGIMCKVQVEVSKVSFL